MRSPESTNGTGRERPNPGIGVGKHNDVRPRRPALEHTTTLGPERLSSSRRSRRLRGRVGNNNRSTEVWGTDLDDQETRLTSNDRQVIQLQTQQTAALTRIGNLFASPKRNPKVTPCICRCAEDEVILVRKSSLVTETCLLKASKENVLSKELTLEHLTLGNDSHALAGRDVHCPWARRRIEQGKDVEGDQAQS